MEGFIYDVRRFLAPKAILFVLIHILLLHFLLVPVLRRCVAFPITIMLVVYFSLFADMIYWLLSIHDGAHNASMPNHCDSTATLQNPNPKSSPDLAKQPSTISLDR